MRRAVFTGLLAALAFIGAGSACAADIYVVGNSSLRLSIGDIREIYLGDLEFSGSQRIIPVDNQAVQAEFSSKVLAMGLDRYNTLWTKKSFRDALNPPAVKATDTEVLNFVRHTRGAIGYVSSPPNDKNVVVLGKF